MSQAPLYLPLTVQYDESWRSNLRMLVWHAGYRTKGKFKDLVAIDVWGIVREVFSDTSSDSRIFATHDVPCQSDFPLTIRERTRWLETLKEGALDDQTQAAMPEEVLDGATQPLMAGPWDRAPGIYDHDADCLGLRPPSPAQENAIYVYRVNGSEWHLLQALGAELPAPDQTGLQQWMAFIAELQWGNSASFRFPERPPMADGAIM